MRKFTSDEVEEIKRSYREAIDKKAQIGILDDLNACGRDEIKVILGLLTELPAAKPVKDYRPRRRHSQEFKDSIVAEVQSSGLTQAEIAAKHDIAPQQVSAWVRAAVATEQLDPINRPSCRMAPPEPLPKATDPPQPELPAQPIAGQLPLLAKALADTAQCLLIILSKECDPQNGKTNPTEGAGPDQLG